MNHERLIFHSPENAADFTRTVEGRIAKESTQDFSQPREIVSQELAKQFEQAGHGVSALTHPWEHSEVEHQEVQRLVEFAFAHDLTAAISQAEKSPHFPRNIDLFHDVLTGEMYEAIRNARINVHHTPLWIILLIALFFMLLIGAIFLFMYPL